MVVGLVQVLAQPIKDNKAALDNFIVKRSPCINCKNDIETVRVDSNNKYKCNSKRSPCIQCKNKVKVKNVNSKNKYECKAKRSPCVNCKNKHETTHVHCKDEKKDGKKSDTKTPIIVINRITVRPKEEESSKSGSHSKGKKDSPVETERVEVHYPKEDSSEHDKHWKTNKYKHSLPKNKHSLPKDKHSLPNDKHSLPKDKHYRVKPVNEKDGHSDARFKIKGPPVWRDMNLRGAIHK
jgi:hypothetical protein